MTEPPVEETLEESKIEQVVARAKEILKDAPDGLRFKELIQRIRNGGMDFLALPSYVQWLPRRNPEIFSKPSRGLFVLTEYSDSSSPTAPSPQLPPSTSVEAADQAREQKFYASFADYLVHDLDECTRAIPVGGNAFGGKWGTPDVMGVTVPRPRDIYKAPLEIISAEIKVATGKELITAFGQACSYQLFSHKTYVVVPASSKDIELDRLETLCQVFGIGLILFDSQKVDEPNYSIRVRALRREPNSFYINETLNNKIFDDLLAFAG